MKIKCFLAILLATLSSCATAKKSRSVSEYLLTSDLNVITVFSNIQSKLVSYKYKPKTTDAEAGILVFEPREFSYTKKNQKIQAQQALFIRQEGGSVKLRISYDCNYSGKSFEPCRAEDKEVNEKISRIEPSLVKMIRPLLVKHEAPVKPQEELKEETSQQE